MPSDKLPFFKKYPGDWLKNLALRTISFSARGLLSDLECFMHDSEQRGYLVVAGKPLSIDELCSAVGSNRKTVEPLLRELIAKKILVQDKDGVISFPSMVESERARLKAKKDGSKGGNPKLRDDDRDGGGATIPKENPKPVTKQRPNDSRIEWNQKRYFPRELIKLKEMVEKEIADLADKLKNSFADKVSHNVCYIYFVCGAVPPLNRFVCLYH